MYRLAGLTLLLLSLAAYCFVCPMRAAWAEDSVSQERLAYIELSRVRALSKPDVSYNDYRDAVVQAREYVSLLKDVTTSGLLRTVMNLYNQALAVWKLQSDSEFPVDSLRSDEPVGAGILAQCPDIPHFHYKEREQIYVQDALACIWLQAGALLDTAPAELH